MSYLLKKTKLKLIGLSLLSVFSYLNAEGTFEKIAFIGDDLETGLTYQNVRYDYFGEKGMLFGVKRSEKIGS
jgi:hypothetical protein